MLSAFAFEEVRYEDESIEPGCEEVRALDGLRRDAENVVDVDYGGSGVEVAGFVCFIW